MNNNEFYISDAIDVIEEMLASGGEVRLSPRGISMLPIIKEGRDTVKIVRDPERKIKKHDIIFYVRDDCGYVIHRVHKCCSDGTYILNGDNQLFLERGIRRDQIIGHISQIYRKGEPIMDTFKYKIYVFLWSNLFLRRVVFKLRGIRNKSKK